MYVYVFKYVHIYRVNPNLSFILGARARGFCGSSGGYTIRCRPVCMQLSCLSTLKLPRAPK